MTAAATSRWRRRGDAPRPPRPVAEESAANAAGTSAAQPCTPAFERDDQQRRKHHVELERGEAVVPVGGPTRSAARAAAGGRAGRPGPTRGRPCRRPPGVVFSSRLPRPSWPRTNPVTATTTTMSTTRVAVSQLDCWAGSAETPRSRGQTSRAGSSGSCTVSIRSILTWVPARAGAAVSAMRAGGRARARALR